MECALVSTFWARQPFILPCSCCACSMAFVWLSKQIRVYLFRQPHRYECICLDSHTDTSVSVCLLYLQSCVCVSVHVIAGWTVTLRCCRHWPWSDKSKIDRLMIFRSAGPCLCCKWSIVVLISAAAVQVCRNDYNMQGKFFRGKERVWNVSGID